MPTICELTLQLKQKGIKGYSGKNKAQLLNMLANTAKQPEAEIKNKVKKKQKKEPEKQNTPLSKKKRVSKKHGKKKKKRPKNNHTPPKTTKSTLIHKAW